MYIGSSYYGISRPLLGHPHPNKLLCLQIELILCYLCAIAEGGFCCLTVIYCICLTRKDMHWNLVSKTPLCQSSWFSLDSLLPYSFPPKQNSGEGGVWSPLGASAEPLPHPTLASAHQDAIISGAMTITWSRKALFRYVYISYNKFTPLLILLFTMNMAKVTIGLCPLSRVPPSASGGATTLL